MQSLMGMRRLADVTMRSVAFGIRGLRKRASVGRSTLAKTGRDYISSSIYVDTIFLGHPDVDTSPSRYLR